MSDLITLDYAKAHVRLDHDAEDVDVMEKIAAASAMIINYLKDAALTFLDENGDPLPGIDVPADVKSACATLVAMLFKDRDGTDRESWPLGYLPFQVTSQIYMRRWPAYA
jgi:hypothetical protein